MKEAYLVAWIDPSSFRVEKVGIYSEPYPTPGKQRWQPAALAEARGAIFDAAVMSLCERIATDRTKGFGPRNLGWTYKLLQEHHQVTVEKIVCPHCHQPLVKEDR